MIKDIYGDNGLKVTGFYTVWPRFHSSSTENTLAGQIRYNGNSQNLEVHDGQNWVQIFPSSTRIELSSEVQAVISWAQSKMFEEERFKQLAKQHPAVADAVEAVEKAQEQLKLLTIMVDNK